MGFRNQVVVMTLAACAVCVAHADVRVTEGRNVAVSPDGRRIAFERAEGAQMHLAVMELASGKVEWLVRGATENACHPAWSRDGSLVYSYANITNTAYQRFVAKGGPQDGYGLRLWKDGATCELTHGLWRDFSPSFSPDGGKLYLCTQHGLDAYKNYYPNETVNVKIDELDVASGARRTFILPPPIESSLSQPVVSPDGRLIAWAVLEARGGLWCVKAARMADLAAEAVVNGLGLSAYAPNWSPDGRYLAYTGFAKGDGGWQVYVTELASGAARRVCAGENAAFSADGKAVFFDRDGAIWRHDFASGELPHGPAEKTFADEPEKVVVSLADPKPGENIPFERPCSFARRETVFIRARLRWDGDISHYQRVCGINGSGAADSSDAFAIYISKSGFPHVSVRSAAGVNFSLPDLRDADVAKKPGEIVLTGIRTATDLYVSVNGRRPVRKALTQGALSLGRCETYWIGREMNPTTKVASVEIGTGWPTSVPKPLTGGDLVK